MEISQKAPDELKEIWKKQFGEEIPNKDANEEASNLLRLFEVIYRPCREKIGKATVPQKHFRQKYRLFGFEQKKLKKPSDRDGSV